MHEIAQTLFRNKKYIDTTAKSSNFAIDIHSFNSISNLIYAAGFP